MLYFFTGSDSEKTRAKAFAWVAAARTKAPDAPYLRLGASDITAETLAEAAESQGLFYAKSLVLLDDPFSDSAAGDIVMERLSELAESANPIAILAPKLLPARRKTIEAKAAKTFVHDLKEKKPARGFNTGLVNALGAKNGPALWKELMLALRAGDAPEALHGLLHWKARDMMQKGNAAWGTEGARELPLSLIELLSDSRGGDLPLAENLERWALSL